MENAMSHEVLHSDATSVIVDGIEIVYDTFGDPSAPPMLLVAGLGVQMIDWDEAFCRRLAAHGYWVIRFDNRDVGLSTKFDEAGVPNIPALMQAQMLGGTIRSPYLLRDMAADAAGLLKALHVERAHVVGVSLGGMIAQELVIRHAECVRTLTSIMSTTGNPGLPLPKPAAMAILLETPPADRRDYIESSVRVSLVLGAGLPYDEASVRERAGRSFDRGLSPAGTARQLAAVLASGSRKEALKAVSVPALVIHGDADPLVPVAGGIDTADAIPGAKLMIVKGMGHALPPAVWPQVIEAVAGHAMQSL
jgi:pimeloyl-ACP methyl ester carboxylesterase